MSCLPEGHYSSGGCAAAVAPRQSDRAGNATYEIARPLFGCTSGSQKPSTLVPGATPLACTSRQVRRTRFEARGGPSLGKHPSPEAAPKQGGFLSLIPRPEDRGVPRSCSLSFGQRALPQLSSVLRESDSLP